MAAGRGVGIHIDGYTGTYLETRMDKETPDVAEVGSVTEVAHVAMQGRRKNNEDASRNATINLQGSSGPSKQNEKAYQEALTVTFNEMQARHGEKEGGSTLAAAIAHVDENNIAHFAVAHVGDTETFVVIVDQNGTVAKKCDFLKEDGSTVQIDVPLRLNQNLHSAKDPNEKKRIEADGRIVEDGRVLHEYPDLGRLAVSRAIGDKGILNQRGEDTNKKYTSKDHEPEVKYLHIKLKNGQTAVMVSACDGLCDKINGSNAADTAKKRAHWVAARVEATWGKPAIDCGRQLAKDSFEGGSEDNITVNVLKLKKGKPPVIIVTADGHGGKEVSNAIAPAFIPTFERELGKRLGLTAGIQQQAAPSPAPASMMAPSGPAIRRRPATPAKAADPATPPVTPITTTAKLASNTTENSRAKLAAIDKIRGYQSKADMNRAEVMSAIGTQSVGNYILRLGSEGDSIVLTYKDAANKINEVKFEYDETRTFKAIDSDGLRRRLDDVIDTVVQMKVRAEKTAPIIDPRADRLVISDFDGTLTKIEGKNVFRQLYAEGLDLSKPENERRAFYKKFLSNHKNYRLGEEDVKFITKMMSDPRVHYVIFSRNYGEYIQEAMRISDVPPEMISRMAIYSNSHLSNELPKSSLLPLIKLDQFSGHPIRIYDDDTNDRQWLINGLHARGFRYEAPAHGVGKFPWGELADRVLPAATQATVATKAAPVSIPEPAAPPVSRQPLAAAKPNAIAPTQESESTALARTMAELKRNPQCGKFVEPNMSADQAVAALKNQEVGSYIIRQHTEQNSIVIMSKDLFDNIISKTFDYDGKQAFINMDQGSPRKLEDAIAYLERDRLRWNIKAQAARRAAPVASVTTANNLSPTTVSRKPAPPPLSPAQAEVERLIKDARIKISTTNNIEKLRAVQCIDYALENMKNPKPGDYYAFENGQNTIVLVYMNENHKLVPAQYDYNVNENKFMALAGVSIEDSISILRNSTVMAALQQAPLAQPGVSPPVAAPVAQAPAVAATTSTAMAAVPTNLQVVNQIKELSKVYGGHIVIPSSKRDEVESMLNKMPPYTFVVYQDKKNSNVIIVSSVIDAELTAKNQNRSRVMHTEFTARNDGKFYNFNMSLDTLIQKSVNSAGVQINDLAQAATKGDFLKQLKVITKNDNLSAKQLLDLFDNLKDANGPYKIIHKQRHHSLDKARLFFKSNKNEGEKEFWHTDTYQEAVKALKDTYIKLIKNKDVGEDLKVRGAELIDYKRGNRPIHHSQTSSRKELDRIEEQQRLMKAREEGSSPPRKPK